MAKKENSKPEHDDKEQHLDNKEIEGQEEQVDSENAELDEKLNDSEIDQIKKRRKAKKGKVAWTLSQVEEDEGPQTFKDRMQTSLSNVQRYKNALLATIALIVLIGVGYLVLYVIEKENISSEQSKFISAFFESLEKNNREKEILLRNLMRFGDPMSDEVSTTGVDNARKASIKKLHDFIVSDIDLPEVIVAQLYLGNLYFEDKDFEKSIEAYNRVIAHDRDVDNPFKQLALMNSGLCKLELAQQFVDEDDKEKLLALYNEAIKYFGSAKNIRINNVSPFLSYAMYYEGFTNYLLANYYNDRKMKNEASGHCNRAKDIFTQLLASEVFTSQEALLALKDTVKLNLKQVDFLLIKLGLKKISEVPPPSVSGEPPVQPTTPPQGQQPEQTPVLPQGQQPVEQQPKQLPTEQTEPIQKDDN